MPTIAVEEYLAAIYRLRQDEEPVTVASLARHLNLSHASVSLMVKRLTEEGLVRRKDGCLHLAPEGEQWAEAVVRRHRLAERFLADVLHVPWDEVHGEAHRWEHVLSPAVEERMDELLAHPVACPHGYPLPGREDEYPAKELRPLSAVEVGQRVVVVRVQREEPAFLRYLASLGLLPGARLKVEEVAPFGGPVLVQLGPARYALGREVASRILVQGVDG